MQLIATPSSRILAVVLLTLAGCGSATPSPSPAPSPTPPATSSPAVVPTPPATPTPRPSPSVTPAVVDLAIDAHPVAADYAGHISALISLGDELVWAGGQGEADNNLYRYIPGAAKPELLFLNARADSVLTRIAGSAAGYVFTDERSINGQPRGWALWYLAAPAAEPVLLDQSTDDRLPAPTLAMNDRYISWEVVHGRWEDRTNELRFARVADPLGATTLLSISGDDMYLEFPGLWADELWYGIVDNDWVIGAEYPRVEMIDLGNPTASPEVFGADQRAFMPAPGRDVVAWKSGGEERRVELGGGRLTIYWRDSGTVRALPIPGPSRAAARISFPSVGNRFVAWWDDIHPRFYLFDLVEQQFRRVAEYDWAGDELVTRPSVSGDLLGYVHFLSNGERHLEWCVLPE